MYLHCPRCRLAIKCQVDNPIPVNCRRCLARAAIAVPVFASQLNGAELRAADGGDGNVRTPASAVAEGARHGLDGVLALSRRGT
jgi:hypothetical protein